MKNTDIALVIVVATVSVVASYFIGNLVLGDPNDRVESISYMDVISSDIDQPDIETFNSYALNPTVEVYVGNCGPLEQWNVDKMVCESINGTSDDTSNDSDNIDDGTESDNAEGE